VIEVGAPDSGPRDVVVGAGRALPDRAPVLPLRDTVTFPDMVIPLNIGQERSIELINDALRGDRSIVMVSSRNAEVETPGPMTSIRWGCSASWRAWSGFRTGPYGC